MTARRPHAPFVQSTRPRPELSRLCRRPLPPREAARPKRRWTRRRHQSMSSICVEAYAGHGATHRWKALIETVSENTGRLAVTVAVAVQYTHFHTYGLYTCPHIRAIHVSTHTGYTRVHTYGLYTCPHIRAVGGLVVVWNHIGVSVDQQRSTTRTTEVPWEVAGLGLGRQVLRV